MAQQIKLKRSAIAGKVPTTGSLAAGELAVNTVDGKLYFKKDDDTVQTIVTTNALITGSVNISGSITGSDVRIDQWGSVSASLVSVSNAAAALTLQNVTDNGSITDNSIIITGSLTTTEAVNINKVKIGRAAGVSAASTGSVAIGNRTLENNKAFENYSTAVGFEALENSSWGIRNTAVGSTALKALQSSSLNTALGAYALAALDGNLGGGGSYPVEGNNYNTSVGYNSGILLAAGRSNAFLGADSGKIVSGSHNVAVGADTATSVWYASGSIFLGNGAGPLAPTVYGNYDNQLYIHNTASVSPLIYGEFDSHLLKVYGDLHVSESLKVTGSIETLTTITGSDVSIDQWGSVSASLSAIQDGANTVPTLQQVTDIGNSTTNAITASAFVAGNPSAATTSFVYNGTVATLSQIANQASTLVISQRQTTGGTLDAAMNFRRQGGPATWTAGLLGSDDSFTISRGLVLGSYDRFKLTNTGAEIISGSLYVENSITGSSFKGDGSAITGVVTSSYALTASYAANVPETASYALEADKLDGQHGSYYLNASNINAGTISDAYLPSSISSDITGNAATATTASFASTASAVNTLSQNVTIVGNLEVFGTSSFTSVTSSQLIVDDSFISVNVFEPAERFGGLKVYDSGSLSHLATASLAWDSTRNHWVYQNASGSTYTGGMLLSGPRNTGSLGDEPTLATWFVPRSDGGDHLENSQIFSSGSTTIITGSLTTTGKVTINTVDNYGADPDKFLAIVAGEVVYRTGAELLSDIGGQTSGTFVQNAGSGGQARYIMRYADSNSATTSSIYEDTSGNIGIKTIIPSYGLDINTSNIRVGVHTIGTAGSAVTSSLAIGQDALGVYTGSNGMTAIGWKALSSVTSGPNDAIGAEAMRYSVSATYNTAIGAAAGYRSQGPQNTFIGQFSGPYYHDLTEGYNTFIGPLVGLFSSGSARQNTGIGASALYNLITADSNTAIGSAAGFELTTGGFNTFLGDQAGRGVTTGARNTVIGRVAGLSSTLTKSIIIGDGDGTVRYRYDNTADNTFISSSLTTSGFISASGLIYAPNIGAGVDNSVVILDSDGTLRTDEIDARVWGTSLVDGSGATNRVAYWSDADTLTSDADFTFDGTSVGIGTGTPSEKLTVEGNISASGDLLLAHPNTPMVKLVDTTNDLQARFRVANSYAYLSVDNSNTVGSSRLVFQVDGDEAGYFDGNGLNVDGDLTVTGTVTAQEFHTEFVSASVIYQSGSTKFGDTVDDIHSFTGSLEVTGGITGSLLGTATSASYALTASYVDLSAANYVDTYSTTGADNRIAVYRDVNTIEGDTEFTYDGTSLRVNGSQMRYGQSLGSTSGKLAFPVGSGTSADGFTADYVITSGSGAGKVGYRAGHVIAAFGINGASPVLTETQTNTIGSMPSIVTAVSASGTDMFLTFEWSGGSSIYSKVNVFTLGL